MPRRKRVKRVELKTILPGEVNPIMEEFISRYLKPGQTTYTPPYVDTTAQELEIHEHLERVRAGEIAYLSSIANVRFVG